MARVWPDKETKLLDISTVVLGLSAIQENCPLIFNKVVVRTSCVLEAVGWSAIAYLFNVRLGDPML